MEPPNHALTRRKARVFAPYLHPSSFVMQDFEFLEDVYDLRTCHLPAMHRPLPGLGQVPQADLLLCWFGSVRFLPYILVARLLRKPVLVVAGGYDVASEPSINYGNMRGGLSRLLGRLLFRLATVAVAFSEAGRREMERNAGVPRVRSRMIPLGFKPDRPPHDIPPHEKEPMVLSVGIIDESTIHRKGLLTLAHASRLCPDVPTVFVGRGDPGALADLQRAAGSNARFLGFVTEDELDSLYRRAAVYVQASLHEGFGCSVAEAMLYDCIPVVSDRGALPEVVGPSGYYVSPGDPGALAAAIRRALREGHPDRESPRARIRRLFPAAARRSRMVALVDELLASTHGAR
jgi:glycosyltransferase involved in cell wall biosynthesis